MCVTLQLAYSTLLLLWVIALIKILLLEAEAVVLEVDVMVLPWFVPLFNCALAVLLTETGVVDGTFPKDADVDRGIAPENTGKRIVQSKQPENN